MFILLCDARQAFLKHLHIYIAIYHIFSYMKAYSYMHISLL